METLNRSAIVLKPKQPFVDWLHAVDPTSHDIRLFDVAGEPTIYLIPPCESNDQLENILRDRCEEIFEEQLDSWYRESSSWPQNRGYEVFCEWFEYQHASMLLDLCNEPPIRH